MQQIDVGQVGLLEPHGHQFETEPVGQHRPLGRVPPAHVVGRAVKRLGILPGQPPPVGHRQEDEATGTDAAGDRRHKLADSGDVLERVEGARDVEVPGMAPRELAEGRRLALHSGPAKPLDRIRVVVDTDRPADERFHRAQEGTVAAAEVGHPIRGRQLAGDLRELPPERLVGDRGRQPPVEGRVAGQGGHEEVEPAGAAFVQHETGTRARRERVPGEVRAPLAVQPAAHRLGGHRPDRRTGLAGAQQAGGRLSGELSAVPRARIRRARLARQPRHTGDRDLRLAGRAAGGAWKTYSLQPSPPPAVVR
ncbi:MAG TPA: hypothetical protein VIX86_01625 [Streptosporangiaceae bacterium]